MVASGDSDHSGTASRNCNEDSRLRRTTLRIANGVSGGGSGFVVYLTAPGTRTRIRGYLKWGETGVGELVPNIDDAWKYPTLSAANSNAHRAFGMAIENWGVAIFPVPTKK